MKKRFILLFLSSTLFLSCIDDDANQFGTDDSERIGIGAYKISEASQEFVPYFNAGGMVMVDANGDEFFFQKSQGALAIDQPFARKFPHPNEFDRDVIYDFSGEFIEFELLNTQLGVKFEVILKTDICSNPNLEEDGQVRDHLQIEGSGFRSPEALSPIPTLIDIIVEERNICREDGFAGIFASEITLINNTFNDVFRRKVTFGDEEAEVFYNAEQGIVGFRYADIFWELKELL